MKLSSKNIITNSSVFIAYLTFLGWSVAYIYGWAKSYYYNYPWELVEVGINNIARALGYILFVSLIISTLYILGLVMIRNAKRLFSNTVVSSIRTFVVLGIVFAPLLIQISLFTHETSYFILFIYLSIAILVSILCKRHHYNINFKQITLDIKNRKIHLEVVLIMVYIYFALSAFMIGYYRPIFKQEYSTITLFNEDYYILAKSNEKLILSQDIDNRNMKFFIYPCINHMKPCPITIKKKNNI